MPNSNCQNDLIRMRSFSAAFSRKSFMDILEYNDYNYFDWLFKEYGRGREFESYLKYLSSLYSQISTHYRCEYVYKNELINKLLLKKYGTQNTTYISEFRVQDSIVDMAMFNGESKAFEIKTEYDTKRRLCKQMQDYKRLFDKCYVVIPIEKYKEYEPHIDENTGILLLSSLSGRIVLEQVRVANQNPLFDKVTFASCLRTDEYKDVVKQIDGDLPNVPEYQMFDACKSIIANTDESILRPLFLKEIKSRRNNTALLNSYPASLRQMMLSLNLTENKADILIHKLNNPLTLS